MLDILIFGFGLAVTIAVGVGLAGVIHAKNEVLDEQQPHAAAKRAAAESSR